MKKNPMKGHVAAISVGIVGAQALCDLEYVEDSAADTDMNVVMTEDGKMIEIQGTAKAENRSATKSWCGFCSPGGIRALPISSKRKLRWPISF